MVRYNCGIITLLSLTIFYLPTAFALQRLRSIEASLPTRRRGIDQTNILHDSSSSIIQCRGGGGLKKTAKASDSSISKNRQRLILASTSVAASCLLWIYREHWIGLFNKERLQAKALNTLQKLDALPKHQSYTTYMAGMIVWEALGLSTVPVESAAGMVFGWSGFVLSATGKVLGACLAFGLARYGALAGWIQKSLSGNSFLQLVNASADDNPLLVVALLKCSSFPETIKNYGSSMIQPIQFWMFLLATVIHGSLFSALWTYLGVDTAARLVVADDKTSAAAAAAAEALPPDRFLQTLLLLALINGIVVSPLAMAVWVKSLKDTSSKKTNKKRKQKQKTR